MQLLSVVGARPQFVKAAVVSRALREAHDEQLVHTGQHYDAELSDVFFTELGLPEPAYNLGVGSEPHGPQTAAMIDRLSTVVRTVRPDAIVTYGDTNSTLAAAIVGAKTDAVVGHVEAGLRSFERSMPEELNRVVADHAADLCFAPTEAAMANLQTEGLGARAYRTGDVMCESLALAADRAADVSDVLDEFGVRPGEFLLATVHRPRNTDDAARLRGVLDTLAAADLPVVLPAHPRTEAAVERLDRADWDGVRLVDPLGYVDFVRALDAAERVVTDSGGVQKEAFLLDTPCVTLREETEWVETVEAGWNVLVGADPDRLADALVQPFDLTGSKPQPYGDGMATVQIRELLEAAVAGGDPTDLES